MTLVDARTSRLDECGLRRHARAIAAECGSPFSSRSYRYPFALVAWHDGPVGVDIERIVTYTDELASVLCTPDEAERTASAARPDEELTDVWSSKEALAKALGDPLAYEPSTLPAPASWPDGHSGRWQALRVGAPPGHTAWLCWRAADLRR